MSVMIPFTSGCPHREAACRYVLDWYRRHHPRWEVVQGSCDGEWSKGRAAADAVRQASGDVLVVADADVVVPAQSLEAAVAAVAAGAAWAVPHKTVYRLSEAHTARVLAGAAPGVKDLARFPYSGVKGGGVVVVSRAVWETSGGPDPRFVGWGGEDLSWGRALETLCGIPAQIRGPLFHLWHPQEDKGRHRRGSVQSEELAGRYRRAAGDREAMAVLVAEHALIAQGA